MKHSRTLVLILCAAVGGAVGLWADDSAKAAQVDEIFRLAKTETLQRQVMQQMRRMTASAVAESGIPPEARKTAAELADRINELFERELAWEKLKPIYAQLYMETFTEDELKSIADFYRTPGGQALVTKLPTLMSKSGDAVQKLVVSLMPEVNQLTRDYLEKYRKGQDAPQSQPVTPQPKN